MASTSNNIYTVTLIEDKPVLITIMAGGTLSRGKNSAVNEINQQICDEINKDTRLHMETPFLIRYADISSVIYATGGSRWCSIYYVLQVSQQGLRLTCYMKDTPSPDRAGVSCPSIDFMKSKETFEEEQLKEYNFWLTSNDQSDINTRHLLGEIIASHHHNRSSYCQKCLQSIRFGI